MVRHGEIWFADFPDPVLSGPGFGRPVLVIQSDTFNDTRLNTVVVVSMTTNLKLAASPGNVLVRASEAPVPEDSVAVVTQNMAIDRSLLLTRYGEMPYALMEIIDEGVRVVLDIF